MTPNPPQNVSTSRLSAPQNNPHYVIRWFFVIHLLFAEFKTIKNHQIRSIIQLDVTNLFYDSISRCKQIYH